MTYIHRDIEPALKRMLASFPSIAVTGPRQTGKSTLLRHQLPGYRYLSLDNPLLREQAISDPELFLDSASDRVIVDEIQLAPGLLSYIKIRIDANRKRKGGYVFTGSQQFTMIRDLGDSLAGRIGLLDLLPFSVAEKRRAIPMADGLSCFRDACLRGSWPELVVDTPESVTDWYGSYLQTYIERDVRTLHNIGNLRDFQRFMQLLAARCSQMLNQSELAGEVGVSVPTIKSWLSVLEASRLVFLLPPFHANAGKRIVKAPKVYFTDCGLVCYLTGIRDEGHLLQGPMTGALFENFCIQEALKIFNARGERPPLYYLRTNNGLEVDLLVETAFRQVIPVEFKSSRTPSRAMADGIRRFRELFPEIETAQGMVTCLVDEPVPLLAGIDAVPVDGFLRALPATAPPDKTAHKA